MISNYKNIEFQLYGYLIQLREFLKTNNIGEFEIENINDSVELIQSRKFNIAVMGEFKRGKSSLINAMLGMKILPSDVTPATATINRITYGTEPLLTILYNDGTTEIADMNNISNYVTMLTEEGRKRAAQIKEAIINYPTVICQNHIDIIDTPGLNDNLDMTKVTMSMLHDIDAAIVVISALAPFSEKENEFVCELIKSDNIENIVFVVTYIDQIDEDEQDKLIKYIHSRICKNVFDRVKKENNQEEILLKARRLLDKSLVFGVSSLLALKSFIMEDRNLLKKSRFEIFKTEIYEFLTSEQGTNMIIKTIKSIRNACSQFEKLSEDRISHLEQDLNIIDEKSAVINNYCIEGRKKLEALLEDNEKQFEECLNNVLKLKNTFINNFTNSLYKIQSNDQNEILNALSSEAALCWTIANERFSEEIKKQIFDIFTYIIESYCSIRNQKFIEPATELNKLFSFDWEYSQYFNANIMKTMTSFGFPVFSWQVSPVPNAQYLFNYNILDNIKYAVDISLERYYEHWSIYANAAKNWWLKQIDNEASSIAGILGSSVKRFKENKRNELFLLKDRYEKQKITIQDIKIKTDTIFDSLYENFNGS